jgi:hypothetical protein
MDRLVQACYLIPFVSELNIFVNRALQVPINLLLCQKKKTGKDESMTTIAIKAATVLAVLLVATPTLSDSLDGTDTATQTPPTAGEIYRTDITMSGFLLRSVIVCGHKWGTHEWQRTSDVAIKILKHVQDFTTAFPKTAEQWGKEGAYLFNDNVMASGIDIACSRARELHHSLIKEMP